MLGQSRVNESVAFNVVVAATSKTIAMGTMASIEKRGRWERWDVDNRYTERGGVISGQLVVFAVRKNA